MNTATDRVPDTMLPIRVNKFLGVDSAHHIPSIEEILDHVPADLEILTIVLSYAGPFNPRRGAYLHTSSHGADQLADWHTCFFTADVLIDFGWWVNPCRNMLIAALQDRWPSARIYTHGDGMSNTHAPKLLTSGLLPVIQPHGLHDGSAAQVQLSNSRVPALASA